MQSIEYKPIGVIHCPFRDRLDTSKQPDESPEARGEIELYEEYLDGLEDLEGFSHIVVVFHMHLNRGYSLKASPPWDNKQHGVFATRSPDRPNPIGISVVRLESVENNVLNISGIDILDGTPVLDIKPYVPEMNREKNLRIGWLKGKLGKINKRKSSYR